MPSRKPSAPRATAKKSTARPKHATQAARPAAAPLRASQDSPAARTPSKPQPVAPVSHQEIQLKAFELWQRRGGDHLANWIEAETMLVRERTYISASN